MKNRIVFTGGGSAGHVTPNMALIDVLRSEGIHVDYIGSYDGVERKMIESLSVPYHAIRCGKFRRYFSLKNIMDPFNTLIGIFQAFLLLKRLKPNVVFSKGGFVAFPVVVGAWLCRIPVIAHESDRSPGLANRLSFPFLHQLCVTFATAKPFFKHAEKITVTGTPLRAMLFQGDRARGLALCGFDSEKPCLMVMGGGQGSALLNACVREALDTLTTTYQVVHLCGPGHVDAALINRADYYQVAYAEDALADFYAMADLVVSRAGSNSLYELLALEKPHILVPLSRKASRGDQIQNAAHFEEKGVSVVIDEEALTSHRLIDAVAKVRQDQHLIRDRIRGLGIHSATSNIVSLIRAHMKITGIK